MSASDHLHPAQLGPTKTMIHGSHSPTPPHLAPHPQGMADDESYGNMSGSVIHTGTEQAVNELGKTGRPFLHMYEMDTSKMNPHVWGDDPDVNYSATKDKQFKERTQGMTLEDTENTPLKASMVTESGQAHAYRNRGEDAGNISVAFPKSAIESGAVRYVGTRAHPSVERAVSTMTGA